jgi:hypothetical protein
MAQSRSRGPLLARVPGAGLPPLGVLPGPARHLGLALLGLVLVLGAAATGPLLVAGGVLALVLAVLLLAHPRAAAALLVLAVVLMENNPDWGVPITQRLYQGVVSDLAPADLLLIGAVAATGLVCIRRGEVRVPTPFGPPLTLLLLGFVLGVINGRLGGESRTFQLISTTTALAPLFLVPVIVVNLVEPGADLVRWLGRLSGLAIVKAVLGLGVVFLGIASAAGPGLPPLTYYEPTSNLLLMLVLLGVAAALLARVPLPRWVTLGTALVVLSLVLSYRRTFWLATLLALAIVLVVAGRRTTRRLIVPALLVLALGGTAIYRAGIGGGLDGALATRIESIDPSKLQTSDQDRYRLAERRNVRDELERRPITGIGVAVPWKQRYPTDLSYPFVDFYAHTAFLWLWLREGIVGPIAYFALYGTALWSGVRTFRRAEDGRVRAMGLAVGVGFVGVLVVELASTLIGIDNRANVVLGLMLGLLAVAHRGVGGAGAPGPDRMMPGR